jgi:uncharacterized protein YbjT (DUF2867 family)
MSKTNTTENGPILVLGGTGKTGRRIAEKLTDLGHPVRIGSRSATPSFDWDAPDGWDAALEGVSAIYISYYPDLAVPGATDAVARLTEMALARGIKRLVLMSGRGEEEAQAAERVVMNSAADWTILRCAWFAQNFSENFLRDGVMAGEIVLPVGAVREPFIDADDIADAAIAALTEDRHVGELYELTGPRLLSFEDVTAILSAATGREIAFRRVPVEAYKQGLEAAGLPDDLIGLVLYLMTTVLDGRNEWIADGVERALGRPPHDFADYARDAAAARAWSESAGAAA